MVLPASFFGHAHVVFFFFFFLFLCKKSSGIGWRAGRREHGAQRGWAQLTGDAGGFEVVRLGGELGEARVVIPVLSVDLEARVNAPAAIFSVSRRGSIAIEDQKCSNSEGIEGIFTGGCG